MLGVVVVFAARSKSWTERTFVQTDASEFALLPNQVLRPEPAAFLAATHRPGRHEVTAKSYFILRVVRWVVIKARPGCSQGRYEVWRNRQPGLVDGLMINGQAREDSRHKSPRRIPNALGLRTIPPTPSIATSGR